MISKNLMKALEELGFTYADNKSVNKSHAYAIYGGYLVSVYEAAGKKIAYFNFKFSDNGEDSLRQYDVSESFNSEMYEFTLTDYSLSDDGLRISFSGNVPTFLKLIDKCVEFLENNEIRGVGYCSKCGNKFGTRNPKKVNQGNENMLMCEHCALETIESYESSAKSVAPASKKSTILGVLGSIVFSLIGVLLYFLVYYYLSPAISKSDLNDARYIFCALGTIVSLLAYLGYRLFCKTAGTPAYVAIGVNSLLFTAIGQYLGVVFEFIAKGGFKTSVLGNKAFWLIHLRDTIPADVADNFVSHSSIFYKMLAISLMFAIVGAAIFLLTLHDKTTPKKETANVETIRL